MIYEITQTTTFSYAQPVTNAHHALRMTPLNGFRQEVLDFHLSIDPKPLAQESLKDFYGNTLTLIEYSTPHQEMSVTASARVRVERDGVLSELAPEWRDVRDQVHLSTAHQGLAPSHFTFFSRRVNYNDSITSYAAESFSDSRSIVEATGDLTMRIHNDFDYVPGATDVSTPPSTAFADRRGVCQDFAHIMISGLRGLGLPAAYVSGYLRTVPPEGEARLAGSDATHAWVAVWCGPELGWRGFDPTNAIFAGSDHVILAMGRDYADVSPIDGVFVGSGDHYLSVAVDVVPV